MTHSLIIGSSPLALAEAAHLARLGNRVTIVEKAAVLGGAWGVLPDGPLAGCELGPHSIKPRPHLYNLLQELGVELVPLNPRPVTFTPGLVGAHRLVSLEPPHLSENYIRNNEDTFYGRLKIESRRLALRMGLISRNPTKETHAYPVGGSGGLVEVLADAARTAGAEVQTMCEVQSIRADRQRQIAVIETNVGTIEADDVVITSGTTLENLEVDGQRYSLDDPVQTYREVVFIAESGSSGRFSQVLMGRHDTLVRTVSDVTPYVESPTRLAPNTRWLTVRLMTGVPASVDLCETIFDHLKATGVLAANARMLEAEQLSIDIPYRREERVAALNKEIGAPIRVMYSYDLGVSFLDQAERWTSSLSSHVKAAA